MMENLERYLEDLENRLDEQQEEELLKQWKQFADGEWEEEYFCPARMKKSSATIEWPKININDALENEELMIIREFAIASERLENGDGLLLSVRSNYGVGIIPSILGAEKFIMPYEMDTLPNVQHLEGGKEGVKKLLAASEIDYNNGWGKNVFSVGKKLQKIRETYPKIGKYIRIDHPDCQGPMDLVELLWGSGIFLDLYDEPKLVHRALKRINEIYIEFMNQWFTIVPNIDEYHAWFGSLHKGVIALRDDSAMNLSPDIFQEFILPYDNELLNYYGGGLIHYCGRGEHFAPYFGQMPKLCAINMSQPHLNELKTIFESTVDKGIAMLGLSSEGVDMAKEIGIDFKGIVHSNVYMLA